MATTEATSRVSLEASNREFLRQKCFDVKFDLTGTEYRALENIGTGAYGVVCSALNTRTQEKVAIKKITNTFHHQQTAKRTYREIKILCHFQHENVISIRDMLMPADPVKFNDVYVVMDLMESDLHQIIHSKQELTEEHIRYFLYQILRGLKYVHSASVIHRDLKPSNLLVNGNCDLKIGDFGMARGLSQGPDIQNLPMTHYVATRWYRAPELLLYLPDYATAVDVWSVGCILAEMLGRKPLFPGKDPLSQLKLALYYCGSPSKKMMQNIRSDFVRNIITSFAREPIPWKQTYPNASRLALDLLSKMLQFDPQDRCKVEDALKHPFLCEYHNPDYEPTCKPFNFDFEDIVMDETVVRQRVMQEIEVFEKKRIKRNSYLALSAKLKQSDQRSNATNSVNRTSSSAANLASRYTCATISASSGDTFLGDIIKSNVNPTVQSIAQCTIPDLDLSVAPASVKKVVNTSSSLQPCLSHDITVTSKTTFCVGTDIPSNLTSNLTIDLAVDTSPNKSMQALTPTHDVVMSSAKSDADSQPRIGAVADLNSAMSCDGDKLQTIATTADEPEGTGKNEFNKDTAAMDTKALLKAALLRSSVAKQKGGACSKPVTALQRQKEKEERRKIKLEKSKEKRKCKERKMKEENKKFFTLSEADQNLLARWSKMQETTKPFVHPIRHHMRELIDLKQEALKIVEKTKQPQTTSAPHNQITSSAATVLTGRAAGQSVPGKLPITRVNPVVGRPLCADFKMPLLPNGKDKQQRKDVVVVSLPNSPGTPVRTAYLPTSENPVGYQMAPVNPPLLLDTNYQPVMSQTQNSNVPILVRNPRQQAVLIAQLVKQSNSNATAEFPQGASQAVKTRASVWSQDRQPTCVTNITVPVWSHSINSQMTTVAPPWPLNPNHPLTSSSEGTDVLPQLPFVSTTFSDRISTSDVSFSVSNSNLAASNKSRFAGDEESKMSNPYLDDLAQVTKQMSRSHVEDPNHPPSLPHTPKGQGAGYGVGLDLEDLMHDQLLRENEGMKSGSDAPLSAGLLADWLEVSGNIPQHELEELEKGLDLGSPMAFLDDVKATASTSE